MKILLNKILVLTLVLFSTLSAVEIGLNLKAGLNISKCYYNDDSSGWSSFKSKPLFSPTGGISVPVKLVDRFTIQPEIMFIQTGWGYENSDSGTAYDMDNDTTVDYSFDLTGSVTFSQLEIPLIFKFNFPTETRVRPSLFAGPSLNILLSANSTAKGTLDGQEIDTSYTESKEYYETTSFNVIFGGELDFELPVGYLITDLRYSLGLKSLDSKSDDMKDKGFKILVGYGYNF